MTDPLPPNDREELEARVTALLLGELTAEEADALRQTLAQDAELAKLHERLRVTLDLVRETAAISAGALSEQPAPLKLSPARREALLAHFKTVKPAELARPRGRRVRWLVPLAAAAAVALVVGGLRATYLLNHAHLEGGIAGSRVTLVQGLGTPLATSPIGGSSAENVTAPQGPQSRVVVQSEILRKGQSSTPAAATSPAGGSSANNVTARQSLALPAQRGSAAGNSGANNGLAGTQGKASEIYLGANTGDHSGQAATQGLMANMRSVNVDGALSYLSQAEGLTINRKADTRLAMGTLDFEGATPASKEDIIKGVNKVLEQNGLTAIQDGNTLTVEPIGSATASANRTGGNLDQVESIYQNNVFDATRQPARPTVANGAINYDSTVSLQDNAAQHSQIYVPRGEVPALGDLPATGRFFSGSEQASGQPASAAKEEEGRPASSGNAQPEAFLLTYADSKKVAQELNDLGAGPGRAVGGPATLFGGGRGGRGGGGAGEVSSADNPKRASSPVNAVSDDQNNAVIINAPMDMMPGISNLITKLDIPQEDQTQIKVLPLKYANPSDVAAELGSLFPNPSEQNNQQVGRQGRGAAAMGGGRAGSGGGGAAGAGTGMSDRLKQQVTVTAVPDERTQSVLVTASKDQMAEVEKMVDQLDSNDAHSMEVSAFRPTNSDAADMQQSLQDLFGSTTRSSAAASTGGVTQRATQAANNGGTLSASGLTAMNGGGAGGRLNVGVTTYAHDPTFAEQFGAASGSWELNVDGLAGAETQGREGAKTQEGNAPARMDYGVPLNHAGVSMAAATNGPAQAEGGVYSVNAVGYVNVYAPNGSFAPLMPTNGVVLSGAVSGAGAASSVTDGRMTMKDADKYAGNMSGSGGYPETIGAARTPGVIGANTYTSATSVAGGTIVNSGGLTVNGVVSGDGKIDTKFAPVTQTDEYGPVALYDWASTTPGNNGAIGVQAGTVPTYTGAGYRNVNGVLVDEAISDFDAVGGSAQYRKALQANTDIEGNQRKLAEARSGSEKLAGEFVPLSTGGVAGNGPGNVTFFDNAVRLNVDGSLDESFNPGAGDFRAMAPTPQDLALNNRTNGFVVGTTRDDVGGDRILYLADASGGATGAGSSFLSRGDIVAFGGAPVVGGGADAIADRVTANANWAVPSADRGFYDDNYLTTSRGGRGGAGGVGGRSVGQSSSSAGFTALLGGVGKLDDAEVKATKDATGAAVAGTAPSYTGAPTVGSPSGVFPGSGSTSAALARAPLRGMTNSVQGVQETNSLARGWGQAGAADYAWRVDSTGDNLSFSDGQAMLSLGTGDAHPARLPLPSAQPSADKTKLRVELVTSLGEPSSESRYEQLRREAEMGKAKAAGVTNGWPIATEVTMFDTVGTDEKNRASVDDTANKIIPATAGFAGHDDGATLSGPVGGQDNITARRSLALPTEIVVLPAGAGEAATGQPTTTVGSAATFNFALANPPAAPSVAVGASGKVDNATEVDFYRSVNPSVASSKPIITISPNTHALDSHVEAARSTAVTGVTALPSNKPPDAAPLKPAVPPPVPQPEIQTRDNAFSTFSLNVSDVAFKLAAASLAKGALPDPATVRSEEFINAFDYRDTEPAPGAPIGFAWERAGYPFAHNRDLLRFSVKTTAQGREAGRPLNLVLLLDKSGSMERADRVAIIREALRVLAKQLGPQDTLSVVVFARTARLWADGVPGTQAAALADELAGITPEGGTNLEEAMKLAYEAALRHYLANGENRVVLLTDGAANLGDVEPEDLKKRVEAHRTQGVALDCFGVGWEDYNDNLLEVLSRAGGGRYEFINTPQEAATEFAGQLAGALRVAASDVKVQVEFNPNRVISYRQIGYAKDQLKKEQFRDNTVKAAQLGVREAGNALYTVEIAPGGDGPIATVYVRYRAPGTSDYYEHQWAVPYDGVAPALDKASAAMRLAGTASAFSEWLASSPYAGGVTLDQLLGYVRGVPQLYGADTRPAQLERMIREAKSISGK
jgi:Mg-chelatase subunit ChlD